MGKLSKKLVSIITTVVVTASLTFTSVTPTYAAENTTKETSISPDEDTQAESGGKLQAGSVQDGVILHAWCWSSNTIKANMAEIAAAGYTTIQTSPVQGCLDPGTMSNSLSNVTWHFHYQPTYYNVGNYQLGSKEEIQAMVDEAHKYNIKIIVDVVPNHVSPTLGSVDPDLKSHLHNTPKVEDWKNRTQVTTYQVVGLPDLDTSNSTVQQKMGDMLETLAKMGVDGFRFDAAKSIELPAQYELPGAPTSEYWPTVLGRAKSVNPNIFAYGEVLQGEAAANFPGYAKIMNVSGSTYGWFSREAVGYAVWENADGSLSGNGNNGKVEPKISSGLTSKYMENEVKDGSIPNSKVVSFIETHDTYANGGASRCLSETQRHLAWAMCAGREGSVPLFFNRPVDISFGDDYLHPQGEPFKTVGERGCDDFKDTDVVSMNIFHNDMVGQGEDVSAECNQKVMKIGRGSKGLTLINVGNSTDISSIQTSLPDGTYKNFSSTGGTYTVSGGKISGNMPANSLIIIDTVRDNDDPPINEPSVSASPAGGKFTGSQSVTLGYQNATSGTYSIDGGAEKSYTNGEKITIGANTADGGTVTLKLKATDGTKNAEKSFTFTKSKVIEANANLYIQLPSGWGKPNAYVYDDSGALKKLSEWPGTAMTDEGDGIYSLKLPDGWDKGRVIFNDGGNQYPKDAGLEFTKDTPMIYNKDNSGKWEPYDVTPKELTVTGIDTSVASPQKLGKEITLTGKATGGTGTKSYEFEVSNGTDTQLITGDATGKATWKPSAPGTYTIKLTVSTSDESKSTQISYVIDQGDAPYITGINVTKSGSLYTYSVSATGGEKVGNKLLFYKYMYKDSNGDYKVIQNYSRKTTCTTTYSEIKVVVENSLNEEVEKLSTPPGPVGFAVSLSATSNTQQSINDALIQVKATASNATGTVKYRFKVNGNLEKDFSTVSTFSYTPSAKGTYNVTVDATDSTNKIVSSQTVTFNIIGTDTPLELQKITPNVQSPQVLGTTVKFSAVATGGTGTKQFKFQVINSNGSVVQQSAYSTASTYSWKATAAGTYTIKALVIDDNNGLEQKTIKYTISPNKTFSISSFKTNIASPQPLGTSITMGAETANGTGTVQYRFTALLNGSVKAQSNVSTAKTYAWKPTVAGTYTIKVEAKDAAGHTATSTKSYVINNVFKISKFATNVASPQPLGTAIMMGADTTGAKGTVKYRFSALLNGSLKAQSSASTTKTYTWKPTVAGTYTIKVEAVDSTGKVVSATKSYVVANSLKITKFATSVASPQKVNTSIMLSLAASGGTGSKSCAFTYKMAGETKETVIKNYDSMSFATWKPTKAGTYTLTAYVKDSVGKVAKKSISYVISSPMTITKFATSVASPQKVNTSIMLSLAVTGGTGAKSCAFTCKMAGTTTELAIKGYDSMSFATWKPTKAGTYTLTAYVKDSVGTVAKKTMTYVIGEPTKTLKLTSFATNVASPQNLGTAITMKVAATGTGTIKYRFKVYQGTTLKAQSTSSSTNTYVWKPTVAGNYAIKVFAQDSTGKIVSATKNYVINTSGPKITTFATNVASPQVAGTSITLGATVTGTGTIKYKFQVYQGTTLKAQSAVSTTKTYVWKPTVAGNYTLKVTAQDSTGKTVSSTKSYVINNVTFAVSNLQSNLASPQAVGKAITFAPTVVGATGTIQYSYTTTVNGVITNKTAYSTTKNFTWTPYQAGTYTIKVEAKNTAGKVVSKSVSYVIK